jgi:O-antigen/teichoic acid export membrane protein
LEITPSASHPSGPKAWIWRSSLAILDQGMVSCTQFVFNIILARRLPPADYGAFAVAFSAFLFASGFYNALVLEPVTVLGPACYPKGISGYLRAQLKIHLAVTAVLGLALALGGLVANLANPGGVLGPTLVASGCATPLLLLLWLARRCAYILGRPGRAFFGGLLYFSLALAAGYWLLDGRGGTPATAFLALGAASAPSAALLLFWLLSQASPAPSFSSLWKEQWNFGRWQAGGAALGLLSTYANTYLAAALLGLGDSGILRASEVLSAPLVQAFTSISTLALPILAARYGNGDLDGMRRLGTRVTLILVTCSVVFVAALAALYRPLEQLMYGGKFGSYAWMIPLSGLSTIFMAVATGPSLVLRAIQRPQYHLLVYGWSAPIGLLSAFILTKVLGVAGAALSASIVTAASMIVVLVLYRRWMRPPPERSTVRQPLMGA